MNIDNLLAKVSKPGRYTGGEYGQIIKDKKKIKMRFAFCFPDSYEIGMSNLGIRILYGVLNSMDDVWCERVYAPWEDMEELMREHNVPLWAHESGDPIRDFDFVGFTLQYEMCYTNVLNMLDLGGIPLESKDRGDSDPIVIGGGPCTYNSEPVADFFDVISLGEGEEALPEISRLYISMKESGAYTREKFLREASHLDGFYVPSLYDIEYNEDNTVKAITPKYPDVPAKIRKRIIKDLDKGFFPKKLVMPYIETVQDRIMLEVYRGCIRGCRFCQAGMVYRPVREKSPEVLNECAKTLFKNTGYDEISLSSLSISDYSCLDTLTDSLLEWTDPNMVSLSLPSLRADSFTEELMAKISTVRTGGLTFAPEAGTQRLRDAINKNLDEEDLMKACSVAFAAGKTQVKLYFMIGHPTETYEDIAGINTLAEKVVGLYYKTPGRPKGKSPKVTISCACFIPKPFTAFQWEKQDDMETLADKQKFLLSNLRDRKIKLNYHDAKVSRVEAVLARGSRRLCASLLEAHRRGMKFDSWDEYFDYDKWLEVFSATGVDPAFYANRAIPKDEVLPWDMIDIGVTKSFLLRENEKAYRSETTPNCREKCAGCGADSLGGERAWCPRLQKRSE